jgi:hypothetical protein
MVFTDRSVFLIYLCVGGGGVWSLAPLSSIFHLYPALLVEETGVPGENHRLSQVTDKFYHIMLWMWILVLFFPRALAIYKIMQCDTCYLEFVLLLLTMPTIE